jgi:hypothetical protein
MDIPTYVKNDFGRFYKAMFETQVERENEQAVFLEYAWDMNWCDPCAADPLSNEELRDLGVYWLDDGGMSPAERRIAPQGSDVFVTRLHLRYDAANFPEDLMFKETGDRENFQGRYVLRHPWKGEASCEAAKDYLKGLPKRLDAEAQTLANLTGWDIANIRADMKKAGQGYAPPPKERWWERLWGSKKEG